MPIAALDDKRSTSEAWLGAVSYLKAQPGHSCYNLAYVITEPHVKTANDDHVIAEFDLFARTAGRHSVNTIANTIFPLACYRAGGAPHVYEDYPNSIYPRVKKGWGNYAERMLRRRDTNGNLLLDKEGIPINPLKSLTAKLHARVKTKRGTKTHYELPVSDEVFEISTYDPVRDARYGRGGPCLSHVSFKLDSNNDVRLTAFYRSHFYLERALGNLVGLARLQQFVAKETGASAGPLTLVAAEARLESELGATKAAGVTEFLSKFGI